MHIPFLLSRKYLFSIKHHSFISFINVLSFLGLLIGIASLICVTSIFNGFRLLVRDMLLTIDPHIRITMNDELKHGDITERLKYYIQTLKVQESTSTKIIISNKEITQAGMMLGVQYFNVKEPNRVAIGIGLADKLGVKIGDTISLSTPSMLDIAISGMTMPVGIRVIIDSVFHISSGVQYDNSFLMGNLQFLLNNGIAGKKYTDLYIEHPDDVDGLKSSLQQDPLLQKLHIETWKDLHKDLYSTMEFERNMSFIILGIISFVSAFNILIAMWMMVKSKLKDIAMLLSMGANEKDIRWTFLLQGLIIGTMGSVLGGCVGTVLCYGQQYYGWISLPNSIVPTMPIALSYDIVCISIILGIVVSGIAGIYPSLLATQTNISEQLRQE